MSRGLASRDDACSVPEDFELRPGRADDFDFARRLYFSSMKPLLEALGAWKKEEMETAFEGYFKIDEIRVITLGGDDVGWIQVSRSDNELCIDQLHLVETARDKGIGTALINSTIAEAAKENKNVSLSVVKGNRAMQLYQRLGFQQVGEDSTKIHKRYVTGQQVN